MVSWPNKKINIGHLVVDFLERKNKYFQSPTTPDRQLLVPGQFLMKIEAPSEIKTKNKKSHMLTWSDSNLHAISSMVEKCIIKNI